MKSCYQSRDGSNITHPEVGVLDIRQLTHPTFSVDTFESTFRINLHINLLNQPTQSTFSINLLIKLAMPLACGTLLPLRTHVGGCTPTSAELRLFQVVCLLEDHTLVESWGVPHSNTP